MRCNANKGCTKMLEMFFLTLILFITIFSLHVYPFTTITLRYIGMGIVLLWWGRKVLIRGLKVSFKHNHYTNFVVTSIIIAVYGIAICTFNGTLASVKSVMSPMFNYVVFVVLFAPLLSRMFSSTKQFAECMTLATVIQAAIVYLSFLLPSVRSYLETIQTFTFERYGSRIVGLGIAGAGGSVYLFCGLICCSYLLLYEKVKILNIIYFALIFGAICLVGRTGFYCALVLLLYVGYYVLKRNNALNVLKIIGAVFVVGVAAVVVLSKMDINLSLLEYTFGRLDELWTSKKTLNILQSDMPHFAIDFIFGTGETKGLLSDGQRVWHDSGYVQRYLALGIFAGTISYVSLLLYYLREVKVIDKNKKVFFLIIIALLFIIEYKEPFIYSLAYPAIILILLKIEDVSNLSDV